MDELCNINLNDSFTRKQFKTLLNKNMQECLEKMKKSRKEEKEWTERYTALKKCYYKYF